MNSSIPCVKSTNSVSRIKTLLNNMPSAVDDAMKGLVMANKGLVLLEGHRIIMRRDQAEMKGKVKLLAGGGAGHEPTTIGFVGPGMLTAVVVGNVFSSPPTHTVLQALRELGIDHSEGILIVVVNYSGNRFNFGNAMERAQNEGVNVKMIVVSEDCAFPNVEKSQGRRGLAGILYIFKMAGAMSEEGKKLEEIFAACSALISDMATIGVGVKMSTLIPGVSRCSLILKENELELGLGIFNEPGIHRIPLGTIAEVVQVMLERMINPAFNRHIEFSPSCPVAVLINNLGGSSKLEEYVFVMEVLKQLDNRGFKVVRVYAGSFVSSLESVGFSITLLKINTSKILSYLDAPTSAPAWPRTLCGNCVNMDRSENLPISVPSACTCDEQELRTLKLKVGPKMSDKSAQNVSQVISFATDALASCEHQLNQFDAEVGDGDTGNVMKQLAMTIKIALQTGTVMVKRPFAMLEDMSSVIEASVGGTLAGLYCVFLTAAAKPFAKGNETDPIDAHLWLEALRSGTESLMHFGRAEVGDRTMVDALHSAILGLETGLRENPSDEIGALRLAAEAAQEAVEKTIGMEAHCGKSSEVKRTVPFLMPDPGAAAVGIWMRALYEGVMNAVISLCHFCELHGPSVLFVTQAFHEPDCPPAQPHVREPKSCYGNVTERLVHRETTNNNSAPCEACLSFNPKHRGFLSNDHEGRISYLSTQQATQRDVSTLVRQACTRSLSCEVSPGKEGPVFFGDEVRGQVLSYTFFLKDAQARGFQRWFSTTVLMKDKFFLLNSWPFLVENIERIISELQAKATIVYEREQAECPQRALRLAAVHSSDSKRTSNKPSRSVVELTGNEHVFPWLHLQFTWLLKAGADRLVEKIVEGLPTADLTVDFYNHQETEDGFTLVTAKKVYSPVLELEASASHETSQNSPIINDLRHLRQILGPTPFLSLAYCLMVGKQIVIRGQPAGLTASIANCLKMLVPRSCYQAALNSDQYLDVSQCNVLGVEPQVAVPQPSPDILRLDILQPSNQADHNNANKYNYKITWGDRLPSKCPTLLLLMEKAIENAKLNNSVMHYHFVALKEEWLNIAKVVRRVQHWNLGQPQDVTSLLQAMGAQEQDKALLEFWGTSST